MKNYYVRRDLVQEEHVDESLESKEVQETKREKNNSKEVNEADKEKLLMFSDYFLG